MLNKQGLVFTDKSGSVKFCASARPGCLNPPSAQETWPVLSHRQNPTYRSVNAEKSEWLLDQIPKYCSCETKKLTLLHPLAAIYTKLKVKVNGEAADCSERNGAVEGKQREAPHHEAQPCTSSNPPLERT